MEGPEATNCAAHHRSKQAAGGTCRGCFISPTEFAYIPVDSGLSEDKIFGPVLAITPFDSEAAATAIANSSHYGLAGYLHTNDLTRALLVSDVLDAGQ